MKNNAIFKKIIIANNLKQFEVKEVCEAGGLTPSSSAIKAWMAGSQNKNHVQLSDEEFEAFLDGLIVYCRGDKDDLVSVPRFIENHIMNLMKAGNAEALEELEFLLQDAKDGVGLNLSDTDEEADEEINHEGEEQV